MKVSRTTLELQGEDREHFIREGPVFTSADDPLRRTFERIHATWTPFEGFEYDSRRDQFVVPGFWSVSRSGQVTSGFPPLARSPPPYPWDMVYREYRRSRCRVRVAVHYVDRDVILLCTETRDTDEPRHAAYPDSLTRIRLLDRNPDDAAEGYGILLSEASQQTLAIAPDWDVRSTLRYFLRSGEVVAALDNSLWGPISGSSRGRYPTVRIDTKDQVHRLSRRNWRDAEVTVHGEVVGTVGTMDSAALLVVGADGERRLKVRLDGPGVVGSHPNGFCVHESASGGGSTIKCFDREGVLQWERRSPRRVVDWILDDEGWVYLVAGRTIIALDPGGFIHWKVPATPPVAGLMVADDDICFVQEIDDARRGTRYELVCIGPRHGAPSLSSTDGPRSPSQGR